MPDPRLLTEEELAGIRDQVECWTSKPPSDEDRYKIHAYTIPASPDDVFSLLDHIAALSEQRDEAVTALRRIAGPERVTRPRGTAEPPQLGWTPITIAYIEILTPAEIARDALARITAAEGTAG